MNRSFTAHTSSASSHELHNVTFVQNAFDSTFQLKTTLICNCSIKGGGRRALLQGLQPTLFMWGFWEAIAWDGGDHDLECNSTAVLSEKWHNLVELVEGARPAVNQHERHNLLIRSARRTHVNEVHIQPCTIRKTTRSTFVLANAYTVWGSWRRVYLRFWFWSADTGLAPPPASSSQTPPSSMKPLS